LRIPGCAKAVSPEHPVVVSKFETHARGLEIDAVADGGEIVLWAMRGPLRRRHAGAPPAVALHRDHPPGAQDRPGAGQGAAHHWSLQRVVPKLNAVKVIDCNLRASRSFPFVSKSRATTMSSRPYGAYGGIARAVENYSIDQDYVAVKAPMFSFLLLVDADPMLGVEMASTGEVGCFGDDLHEALLHALLATGFKVPEEGRAPIAGPLDRQVLVRRGGAGALAGDGAQTLRHARC
jgi:carbamoyl-phosphate synthase large subunit